MQGKKIALMLKVALLCPKTVSFDIVVHLIVHISGDWEIQRDGVLDHELRGDGVQGVDGKRGGLDHREPGRALADPGGKRSAQSELWTAPDGHTHRGQALAEGLQTQGCPAECQKAFPEIRQVQEQ